MGMIEKAIKHFEALQKRYTKQHNGKMCEYVKIALDAMYKENELVRCKNCKHLKYGYQCYYPLGMMLNNDGDAYVLVDPDGDFCSYGERRTEEWQVNENTHQAK